MEPKADIALIGLAVMGQNLILNMNDHGFTVVAYNRTTSKVDDFLAHEARGTKILGATSIAEMVAKLKKPRRVMLMVKAGAAVDEFIEQLLPLLEAATSSSMVAFPFEDTNRRVKYLESKPFYIGTGFRAAKKAPAAAPASCRAALRQPGPTSNPSSNPSPPKSPTARRAAIGWVNKGQATT